MGIEPSRKRKGPFPTATTSSSLGGVATTHDSQPTDYLKS